MNRIVLGLVLLVLPVLGYGQVEEKVSPTVLEELQSAQQAEQIPILVRLISPVDLDQEVAQMNAAGVSVEQRPGRIQRLLQQEHASLQQEVLSGIPSALTDQWVVHDKLWLVNLLHLNASPAVIQYLAQQPEVISIHHLSDFQVIQDEPMQGQPPAMRSPGSTEPGLLAINAPAMWALGYSGHGQKALIYDTGIHPDHPAVRERFLYHYTPGVEGWFPVDRYYPGDKVNSHGTHVAGIVLGLDPATDDTIGVAPGARFMSTDPIVSDLSKIKGLPTYIQVYEWSFNPDGDTSTYGDIPVVVNNSWGLASTDTTLCNSFASDMFDALEAASIGVVFSAGNNGPGTATTGRPAFINSGLTNVFATGAVDGNTPGYPIASFSSRGPTICPGTGSLKIKPEVSAPGFSVRSAIGSDDYDYYNGTSMAAPHVTGAFLLLKEAYPYLTSKEILEALYFSAVDLGPVGEDNTYGMGIIDVKAAFDTLAKTHSPVPPQPRINDLIVSEILEPAFTYYCDSSFTVRVVVTNQGINTAYDPKARLIQGEWVRDSLVLDSLVAGEIDTIEFQFTGGLKLGENQLAVRIDWAQGTVDYDIVDNQRMVRIDWRGHPIDLFQKQVVYNFDSITSTFGKDFFIQGWEDFITWDTVGVEADYPGDRAIMVEMGDYLPREDQHDDLILPLLLIAGTDTYLEMEFKYFYRTRSAIFQDSFFVQTSLDCGKTWTTYLAESSVDLNSGTTSDFMDPQQWKTVSLNLGADMVPQLIRFTTVNDYGGNFYLDDISFNLISGVNNDNLLGGLKVHPNPASDQVLVVWNQDIKGSLQVFSGDGRMIDQLLINGAQETLNISSWPAGVYFIQLRSEDGVAVRKLVVGR